MPFRSIHEAKEFLIARIVEESLREGTPLSESERRMLYFCESAGEQASVPEEAEHSRDVYGYEKKIARLIKNCDRRIRSEGSRGDYDMWWASISRILAADDYLGVMIGAAGLRPRGDLLRLIGTAITVSGVLLVVVALMVRFDVDFPSREAVRFYIWAAFAGLALLYLVLRLVLGSKTFNAFFDWVFAIVLPVAKARK